MNGYRDRNKGLRRMGMLALALIISASAAAQWTWTPEIGRWINLDRLPKETAELQLEHARALMMEGKYRQAWQETNKFEDFYGDSELADENQFLRAEIELARGDDLEAAKILQQLLSAYPDTELYDESVELQYEIGDRFYDKGQKKVDKWWVPFNERPLKRAIDVYSMVIENQPFTAAAAEAQYKLGLSHFTREEYTEAAFEYRRVIEDYAGSNWVDEARYGLAKTYFEMSLPPAYDQRPSKLAIEAIDNFVHAYPQDERADELEEKRQEMRNRIAEQRLMTAKFYERRREFKSARVYYEIIVEEFSGTPAADEAQTWLDEHPGVVSLREKYAERGAG